MAVTIIYQRDRDCRLINNLPVLTTNSICRGLAYDGAFLWASAGGEMVQIDPRPYAVVKTTTSSPVETYDDITFDGEYFWGPVSGNAGIAQWDRGGTRVNLIGSISSSGPRGITFDGDFLWCSYLSGFTGTYFIFQTDRQPQSIHKQFNTGLTDLAGLAFDGEFLVGLSTQTGNWSLVYFDRENGSIVRTATGEAAGGQANGLAFDGEFFYTMLSV